MPAKIAKSQAWTHKMEQRAEKAREELEFFQDRILAAQSDRAEVAQIPVTSTSSEIDERVKRCSEITGTIARWRSDIGVLQLELSRVAHVLAAPQHMRERLSKQEVVETQRRSLSMFAFSDLAAQACTFAFF